MIFFPDFLFDFVLIPKIRVFIQFDFELKKGQFCARVKDGAKSEIGDEKMRYLE